MGGDGMYMYNVYVYVGSVVTTEHTQTACPGQVVVPL